MFVVRNVDTSLKLDQEEGSGGIHCTVQTFNVQRSTVILLSTALIDFFLFFSFFSNSPFFWRSMAIALSPLGKKKLAAQGAFQQYFACAIRPLITIFRSISFCY